MDQPKRHAWSMPDPEEKLLPRHLRSAPTWEYYEPTLPMSANARRTSLKRYFVRLCFALPFTVAIGYLLDVARIHGGHGEEGAIYTIPFEVFFASLLMILWKKRWLYSITSNGIGVEAGPLSSTLASCMWWRYERILNTERLNSDRGVCIKFELENRKSHKRRSVAIWYDPSASDEQIDDFIKAATYWSTHADSKGGI